MSNSPRPILKRSSPSRSSSTSSQSSIKVSFSSNISTTYLTHAPSQYNRSPIAVDPQNLLLLSHNQRPVYPIDGYDSVVIRDDEDSDEYYDSLTPLPNHPAQTTSVYAPSPSAFTSYRSPPLDHYRPIPPSPFMPDFAPLPKRKLSDASDNSEKSVDWGCLDGF